MSHEHYHMMQSIQHALESIQEAICANTMCSICDLNPKKKGTLCPAKILEQYVPGSDAVLKNCALCKRFKDHSTEVHNPDYHCEIDGHKLYEVATPRAWCVYHLEQHSVEAPSK